VKTISLKKVAVVAVASLGFGLLSVVPANAAVSTAITGWNGLSTAPVALTGATGVYCTKSLEGAAEGAATCTGQINGQVEVAYKSAGAATYIVRATNASILAVESAAAADLTTAASLETKYNGIDWTSGVTFTSAAAADQVVLKLTATAAGATTVTVHTVSATTGALTLVDGGTITWATSSSLDPSSGNSTSIIDGSGTLTTNAHDAATDETVIASGLSAGTLVASIKVIAKDGNANLLANGKTVTAVVTGAGMAGGGAAAIDSYANSSRYETVTLASGAALAFFGIYADGTAGKSTITIMSGTTTLATETVVFHGRPTKVTVTQGLFVGSTAGGAFGKGNSGAPTGADPENTPAAIVAVTDALGLPVSAQTIVATSDNTLVISGIAAQTESTGLGAGDGYAGEGTYNVSLTAVAAASGSKANVTFKVADGITSGVYISATPVSYAVGGSPYTMSLSTDKTSYAAGSKGTLTVTAKDKSGNAAADATYTTLFSSTGVTASSSFGGSLPGASVATKNGVKTYTFYAPVVGGSYSINGTTGASDANLPGTAVTTSVTVTDANAGLLTQIDALNAKIVALNALIAKIMKKLGVK
jgi:hypothetical protein